MPLEQRVIAPIYVSRGCFTLDSPGHSNGQIPPPSALNIPNELECVTNGTLANIIRQLSSLSRYAEDLFGSLLDDTSTLVQRSVSLKTRLDSLSERVERLDASNDSASLSGAAGANGTLSKKPFRSRADNFDQQVVARTTIPLSLREVYESCDQPPPLDKLNPFRDDNMNGLKLYTNPNYFFELWRKEMLADRSRNKVAKKGETAHQSGKSKRNKASMLRHQGSINSDSTASPNHAAQAAHYHAQNSGHMQGQVAYHRSTSISSQEYSGPIYTENGVMVHPGQAAAQAAYTQQQQKIYGQTGPKGPVYGYMAGPGVADVVSVKREEPNPSGVGTYTVIEGYSVDPNNYQHHYVQYPGGQPQQSNRPNSLELSQQQATAYGTYGGQAPPPPPPPPMDQQYQQYQQQNYQRNQVYGQTGQQNIYGQGPQQQQPQQYSPGSANTLTPTRRAAQLSRPSAPPPAPPSAPNSGPSTPKKVNGGGDMIVAVSGHPPLVSRDSLPPPPPPPPGANGASSGGAHQLASQESVDSMALPPPPPPPPPMPLNGGGGGDAAGGAMTQNGNSEVSSPPPPPPPPMNLNGPMGTAQFKASNTIPNGSGSGTMSARPTAELLQSVKLKPASQNPAGGGANNGPDDARSNLLAAIRHGIKLKRVEENNQKEVEKSVPLHDVASILARRVAMELSDSEGDAEDGDDDSDAWDDESEC